ncbi:hypothetical protein DPX16_0248 [Anabarilius grahami]|uniref:Uncharacterized protein n=1 Tax=Anabarilius grahami TaxID=495550 RepID=A0A3N0YJJ6_ANAGA|nr:hypothetical protein DPX16_0248 [Anabarilius grahami]
MLPTTWGLSELDPLFLGLHFPSSSCFHTCTHFPRHLPIITDHLHLDSIISTPFILHSLPSLFVRSLFVLSACLVYSAFCLLKVLPVCGNPYLPHLYTSSRNRRTDPSLTGFPQEGMDTFLCSLAPASPMPPTSLTAGDRLIGLLQVGRSLERYVEEFVELAFLTNWPDASLIALFLDGLDDDTIRLDEPDYHFSLSETINLILCLNGSKFLVEEVQDKCLSPVRPETRLAEPVGQSPSSSAYPSSELLICSTLDPHSSAGSRKRRRRKKAAPARESTPALSEPVAPALSEPATPVPVGILVFFEGMDWTSLPVSPASAAEPASPASAAEPASPASAAEPASPASAAEPASPEPSPASQEPAPAHRPTPSYGPSRTPLNFAKCFFGGGQVPVGGVHVGATHVGGLRTPPWPAKAPDPPWPAHVS